jgi:hypothetical protein
MSRSYKKNPIIQGGKRHRRKWVKNQANRKVRHTQGIPNGTYYKRIYYQYDVCDNWTRLPLDTWYRFRDHYFTVHFYSSWRRGVEVTDEYIEKEQKEALKYYTETRWKKYYYWK